MSKVLTLSKFSECKRQKCVQIRQCASSAVSPDGNILIWDFHQASPICTLGHIHNIYMVVSDRYHISNLKIAINAWKCVHSEIQITYCYNYPLLTLCILYTLYTVYVLFSFSLLFQTAFVTTKSSNGKWLRSSRLGSSLTSPPYSTLQGNPKELTSGDPGAHKTIS